MLVSDADEMLTIKDWATLQFTSGRVDLGWPPDAFALAASILGKSGAYTEALRNWPPELLFRGSRGGRVSTLDEWAKFARSIGESWRASISRNRCYPPKEVVAWWSRVVQIYDLPIKELRAASERWNPARRSLRAIGARRAVEALLAILAVADEAAAGAGIDREYEDKPSFLLDELIATLAETSQPALSNCGATLTRKTRKDLVRVLPKLHTPQTGLSLRNFSHNLALCQAGDLRPTWNSLGHDQAMEGCINLLLVPFPWNASVSHFLPVAEQDGQAFRRFRYRPTPMASPVSEIEDLLRAARREVGRVDGIVLPELALREAEFQSLRRSLAKEDTFLLSGVRTMNPHSGNEVNKFTFDFKLKLPDSVANKSAALFRQEIEQIKHHRWKLEKSQITQYGLGAALHPTAEWWEDTELGERAVNFFMLRRWLALTVLICEDLSRPDPVVETVRAVGPNLVIALLLDGPQLATRWSSRYATVLADDPGCSVLTLTSLGLCERSRGPDGKSGSRVVALWKDASGQVVEIDLPPAKRAVVVSLTSDLRDEQSADGRRDLNVACFPRLTGINYV